MNIQKLPRSFFASYILLTATSLLPLNSVQAETAVLSQSLKKPQILSQAQLETPYTLGSGDQLRIDVFNVPEYSGEYQVLVDGTLNLPVVGSLPVEGLTVQQATELVSRQYAPFLRRPIVTVSLLTPRPLKIAVSGEVRRPGSYTVDVPGGREFPSVTQALNLAGGITRSAAVRNVQLRRFYQGREQIINLDLWALLQKGDLRQDVTLRDGDTLYIPRTNNIDPVETRQLADASFASQREPFDVAVIGEVNRPGMHIIATEGEGRLTQAIQTAGGITPVANVRNIVVRRNTRDGIGQAIEVDLWELLQTGNVNQDVILQEGDTIYIPTAQELDPSEVTDLAEASFSPEVVRVNVVGEVKSPGTVSVPPNTPLNQALLAAGGFSNTRANTNEVELVRLNPNGTVTKREIDINFEQGINEQGNPPLRNGDVIIVKRSTLARTSDTIGTVLSPLGGVFSLFNFLRVFGF